MQEILKSNPRKYGCDIDEVVKLTHEVVDTVDKAFEDKKNPLGGRYKFGVSAPTYVDLGKVTMATPDGRNANQPFSPHISCADPIAYTELMQFAGQLDYTGCRLNGNVVDFMVTPTFLKKNMAKLAGFIVSGFTTGNRKTISFLLWQSHEKFLR
jgi:pyruvate-formate lyase